MKRFFSWLRPSVKAIQRVWRRFVWVITHNRVLRISHTTLVFFSFFHIAMTRQRRHALYGFIFILPWLIGLSVFTLYPMFYSLYLSFNVAYYNLQEGVMTTWAGFENYVHIARNSTLLPLFINYIGKMLLAVPIIIVFAIIIAVLVNNPIKFKGFWRSIFFLPVIISTGPVLNELSAQNAISLPSIRTSDWFIFITENLASIIADPLTAVVDSLLLILWYAGIPILIFLAGLQKVDPALYEAANIDGASAWQRFWKITLPSIMPLTSVSVIYIIVSMSLFVEPGGILEAIRTHMLVGAPDSAFWFGYGYAAAIAWVYFLLMVTLILVFVWIVSPREKRR